MSVVYDELRYGNISKKSEAEYCEVICNFFTYLDSNNCYLYYKINIHDVWITNWFFTTVISVSKLNCSLKILNDLKIEWILFSQHTLTTNDRTKVLSLVCVMDDFHMCVYYKYMDLRTSKCYNRWRYKHTDSVIRNLYSEDKISRIITNIYQEVLLMNNDMYLQFFISGVQRNKWNVILHHGQSEYMKSFKYLQWINITSTTLDPFESSKWKLM
jgi:hypothetical protein